jgi:glycopeptide antibiotics resistance protein
MKKIRLSTLLWICYSIFVVYATTIPFNVIKSNAELKHNITVISWRPFYNTDARDYFSKGNLITNVLFFIPFGFFGLYSLQNNKLPAVPRVFLLSALGTCLSAFVEFLQLFTIDRNTSDTDLITNTIGTALGIWCASLIKPPSLQRLYVNHAAHFTREKAAFPFAGILVVVLAGALAPFDFEIDRSEITMKVQALFSAGQAWDLNKKDFVIFLYYGALLSFMSATCLKQWRVKKFIRATIALGLATAIIIEGLQLFMFSRFPSWGSFFGVASGTIAGLLAQWFTSRHYRAGIAWFLLAAMTLLLLFFNFAPPVQNASKLGSFLRFSSRGSESIKGLMNFIQITSQFIPVGFIIAYLCAPAQKRLLIMCTIFLTPFLALPLLLLHRAGFPSLYDGAVLIIAEIAVFIGAAACLWAWPVFDYYCRQYDDRRG